MEGETPVTERLPLAFSAGLTFGFGVVLDFVCAELVKVLPSRDELTEGDWAKTIGVDRFHVLSQGLPS